MALTRPGTALTGEREWFVARNQRQFGPYTAEAIQEMARDGQIDAGTLVWRAGMSAWILFGDAQALLRAAPAQASSPAPKAAEPAPAPAEPVEDTTGLTDLNSAPLSELLQLPGMSFEAAKLLIKERRERIGFNSAPEALDFLQLQPHQIRWLQGMICVKPLADPWARKKRPEDTLAAAAEQAEKTPEGA